MGCLPDHHLSGTAGDRRRDDGTAHRTAARGRRIRFRARARPAIANAIFDATGIRFREPPFTPERVLAVLQPGLAAGRSSVKTTKERWWRRFGNFRHARDREPRGGGRFRHAGPAPGGPRYCPFPARTRTSTRPRRSPAGGSPPRPAIARCATARRTGRPGFGGGRAIETPFGIVHASNISPDPRDRDRHLVLSGLRAGDAGGHQPRRTPPLPGAPLPELRQGRRSGPRGALCLPDGRTRHGACRAARRDALPRSRCAPSWRAGTRST